MNIKKMCVPLALLLFLMVSSGCGQPKIEKMIDDAEFLNWISLNSIVQENKAKADDYEDKLFIYTGYVSKIDESYCELEEFYNVEQDVNKICAYLPGENLKALEKGQKITVVGILQHINHSPQLQEALLIEDDVIEKKTD